MTDFLLLYEGGDSKWMENAAPEDIKGVMDQWGAWFKQLEASGHLRNPGAALEALADLLPLRIVVRGHLGDVMAYRLSNVETGVVLDPSLFRFEPPDGVDIVLAE